MQFDRARCADVVALFSTEVVPQLADCEGMCSAELMIDQDSGSGVSMTVWDDVDAATRAEDLLNRLRDDAHRRVQAEITRVESYSLVQTSVPVG